MGKLIDVDSFDSRVRAAGGMCEEELTEDFKDGILTVLEMLKTEPSVQLERKKGKWLRAGTRHGIQIYQCSECGEEEAVPEATNFQTGETSPVWEYCPYCGSCMRQEDNNECSK